MRNKILSAILFLTLSTGCEDFLEVQMKGKATEENFYSTINELQLSLNSVYTVLRSSDFQNTLALIGDVLSDDFIYQATLYTNFGDDGLRLQNFNITSENSWVRTWYTINYKGIYKANQLLSHINDNIQLIYVEGVDDTDIRRWQQIYGQALFLRAYYYFNLVRTFGGLSIIPEVQDIDNPAVPRSTKEETYAYIEKDLRTACILLSEYIPERRLWRNQSVCRFEFTDESPYNTGYPGTEIRILGRSQKDRQNNRCKSRRSYSLTYLQRRVEN